MNYALTKDRGTVDLIGKEFRRNKYGLSNWTDTIKSVSYTFKLNEDNETFTVNPVIISSKDITFELSEIAIIDKDRAEFVRRFTKIATKLKGDNSTNHSR